MENKEIMRMWADASSHRKGKGTVISKVAVQMKTTKKLVEGLLKSSGYWMAKDMHACSYDLSRMNIDYAAMEEFRGRNGLPSGGKAIKPKIAQKTTAKKINAPMTDDDNAPATAADKGSVFMPAFRKVSEYRLLKESSDIALSTEVRKWIGYGYEPIGGVAIANTGLSLKLTSVTYCQAMVKYE